MPEKVFWRLTPAQFFALEKAYIREQKMADYRAAVSACILVNKDRKKGSKAIEPGDFFPSLATKSKAMSKEQMRKHLSSIAKKMKG